VNSSLHYRNRDRLRAYCPGGHNALVNTLEENYCAKHQCPPAKFRREILRRTLHRHALPAAFLLELFRSDYFSLERDFIRVVGNVRSMRELENELREYRTDHRNRQWWRRIMRLRLSSQRFRRLARQYLIMADEKTRVIDVPPTGV